MKTELDPFTVDDKVIEVKAVLNPQYKNLNLHGQDMNRINTNKPLETKIEKI